VQSSGSSDQNLCGQVGVVLVDPSLPDQAINSDLNEQLHSIDEPSKLRLSSSSLSSSGAEEDVDEEIAKVKFLKIISISFNNIKLAWFQN
jgi:hypothetical protein